MIENLDETTFELYASKSYNNPNCMDIFEFHDDLNRIKYIKKLFKKYKESGELKERLILNHLVVLYNVFTPPEACTKILVYKLYEYTDYIKPFLIYLEHWPEEITGIGPEGEIIISTDIPLNDGIVDKLRSLRDKND